MRNKSKRTLKFGRVSMTILPNEVMVFFAGKNKLYFKRFHSLIPHISRKSFLVFSTVLVLSLAVILPNINYNDDDTVADISEDSIIQDDEEKNRILKSSQTDYSVPEEERKLEIIDHQVQPGENLSVIAEKYGISIDTICGSNNLRSYDFIRSGVHLKIPSRDGILYRMRAGNNITALAKKYNVSVRNIISANNLENPDFVSEDSVIFIPDAKPQNVIRGFMWPTRSRVITCGYGWRRNPFNRRYREFHQGLDIRARYSWIRASKYGKVTYTGWMGGYGKTIIIAHPGGWKTLYGHLSRIIVRRGQYVKQGQSIGRSGNTGRSTGPHLHFEIIKSGRHKNPYSYLALPR